MTDRKCVILLFLLVSVAFMIRFKGIWFGYPLPVHPDEPVLVDIALRMVNTGDLNPNFFRYPTLNIYIQAFIFKIMQIFGVLFLDKSPVDIPLIWYYLVGRSFNVLMSVVTIIITYAIGKQLFSSVAGLLAAFFMTFSFLHIENSFLITTDTSVAFWASLVALMAVLIFSNGKKARYYLLGGVFTGLAVNSKYTAFVSVAPLLLAHYLQSRDSNGWVDKNIIMCLVAVPIAFFVTSPYVILNFDRFMADIIYEARHYVSGHPGAESHTSTSYYLYGKYLVTKGYGVFPMIFAGFGLAWLLRKAPWKAAMIVAIPLLIFLFVGRYKVFFPRNLVVAIPFLSLLSGAFLLFVYKVSVEKLHFISMPVRAVAVSLVLVAVLAGSVWQQTVFALNHIETITLPDTRWASLKWIEKNLPAGSRIGREHYTPPVEKFTNKFDAAYLGFIVVVNNPQAIKDFDYMIVSSGDYGRYLWQQDVYPKEFQAYLDFFASHELVKEFVPDHEKLEGPRISIYKIRH
ncbi:MAG TPA: glycosyltransferase family 39 protein [Gammaproteobacteria bacterium]|nr:glycosyltransferase family 39 protein [Gammaproteobacteria bacterium]